MPEPVDYSLPCSRGRAADDAFVRIGGRVVLAPVVSEWVRVTLPDGPEDLELPPSAELAPDGRSARLPSVAATVVRRRLTCTYRGEPIDVTVVTEESVGGYAVAGAALPGFRQVERGVWSGDLPLAEARDLTQDLRPVRPVAPRSIATLMEQTSLLAAADRLVVRGPGASRPGCDRPGALLLESGSLGWSLSRDAGDGWVFERRFRNESLACRNVWSRLLVPADDATDPRHRLAELDEELAAAGLVRGRDYVVPGLATTPTSVEEPLRIGHDGEGYDVHSVVDRGRRVQHVWTRSYSEARDEAWRLLGRSGGPVAAPAGPAQRVVGFRGIRGDETFRRVGQAVRTRAPTLAASDPWAATVAGPVVGVYAILGASGQPRRDEAGVVEFPAGTRLRIVDVVRWDRLGVVLVAEQSSRWRRSTVSRPERTRVADLIGAAVRRTASDAVADRRLVGDIR